MRSRDARVFLSDVIMAARAIEAFTADESLETYLADLKLRSAVERQFEIIGEALNQARAVEPAMIDAIPDARAIIGFRNQLIHGYALVDDEIVWGNALRVPALRVEIEAVLRSL